MRKRPGLSGLIIISPPKTSPPKWSPSLFCDVVTFGIFSSISQNSTNLCIFAFEHVTITSALNQTRKDAEYAFLQIKKKTLYFAVFCCLVKVWKQKDVYLFYILFLHQIVTNTSKRSCPLGAQVRLYEQSFLASPIF